MHRGSCRHLVRSCFNVLVLLVIGIYVVYTFMLHPVTKIFIMCKVSECWRIINTCCCFVMTKIQCRLLKYCILKYLYRVHCSTVGNRWSWQSQPSATVICTVCTAAPWATGDADSLNLLLLLFVPCALQHCGQPVMLTVSNFCYCYLYRVHCSTVGNRWCWQSQPSPTITGQLTVTANNKYQQWHICWKIYQNREGCQELKARSHIVQEHQSWLRNKQKQTAERGTGKFWHSFYF